jgi:hypothetical protein
MACWFHFHRKQQTQWLVESISIAMTERDSITWSLSWTNNMPQSWRTSSLLYRKRPLTKLKIELVNRLYPSRHQPAHQLFTLEEMCDCKPSQFLRHLRSLAPDIPDYLLCILWTSQLPANIQSTLAGKFEVGLDAAALCANRITEAVSPPTLATIRQIPDNAEILECMNNLSCQLVNLTAERNRPNSKDCCTRSSDLPLDLTMPTPSAGTTDATEIGNNVLSPAPTARRETSTADVSGSTRLHYSHRPPLHHRQVQQVPVPNWHGLGSLRVLLQAHPTAQDAS